MELGKAVSYIFQDKRWPTKLLIGWLVSLVPILNFAFTGYVTKTINNVEKKQDEPLPEWDDFGKKFALGFYMWVASIIYAIPVILLSFIFIVPVAIAGNGNISDTMGAVIAGTGALVTCLIVLYALALSLFLPAMNINLGRKETFGSVFEIGEFLRIFRTNSGDYLVAWIMTLVWAIVIGFVASILIAGLSIIPCIGWVAGFLIAALVGVAIPLVYAHLFGQVAAKDTLAA